MSVARLNTRPASGQDAALNSLREYAMQHLDDGVAIATSAGGPEECILVYVNATFQRLTSFNPTEALNRPISLLNLPIVAAALLNCLGDSHENTQRSSGEIAICAIDGRHQYFHWQVSYRRDLTGERDYAIAIYRDVTIQRQCEESLLRAERLASLGAVTAAIAHEVTNPLGAAILAADTAIVALDSPGQQEILSSTLTNVVDSLERCRQIVRTLLRFSRDEPNVKVPCDFNRLVTRSRDLVRRDADKAVVFDVDLTDSLPLICVNPWEIEMVLVNLLRNAMHAGLEEVRIKISTRLSNGRIRLTIQDNGRGMTEEEQEHLFEPLFSSRRTSGGTGLGLYVVSKLIQDHSGTIAVKSCIGKGAVITIELPISSAAALGYGEQSHGGDNIQENL